MSTLLPVKYDPLLAAWQQRYEAFKKGIGLPPFPAQTVTAHELANIFQVPTRYYEGMGRWVEDVMLRAYLSDPNWQIIFRENTPLHHGFDLVTKHVPSGRVCISEMKMTGKVGGIRSYLKHTKKKGRQMSMMWIRRTAEEIKTTHPITYAEIIMAINSGLLHRQLFVANNIRRPNGWLSASYGKMGMKGFYEEDFRKTPGFGE